MTLRRESEVVRQGGRAQQMSLGGLDTGFLVDELNIMTAADLVQTAETIVVKFHYGEGIPAEILSIYEVADEALLKLKWARKNEKF